MAMSSTQNGHNHDKGARHNHLSSSIYFLAVPLTVCVRVRELVCFISVFCFVLFFKLCSLLRNGEFAPIWRNSIG